MTPSFAAGLFGFTGYVCGSRRCAASSSQCLVPLTAGSAIDIVARRVFEQVSKQIGQTVVVENHPGVWTYSG